MAEQEKIFGIALKAIPLSSKRTLSRNASISQNRKTPFSCSNLSPALLSMSHPNPLIDTFNNAGQGQVFAFFEKLDPEAQKRLLAEASEIDLGEVDRLNQNLVFGKGAAGIDLSDLSPARYEALPEFGGDPAAWAKAYTIGEEALRQGRVAAFTVAGGQGTRLGYDGPKGTFAVTPVLKKSLFSGFR